VCVTAQQIINEKATVARLMTAAKNSAFTANEKTAEAYRAQRENKTLRVEVIKLSGELAEANKKLKATLPFMTNKYYPTVAPREVTLPSWDDIPPAPAKAPKKGTKEKQKIQSALLVPREHGRDGS
jgi:hypothetical protein